MLGRHGPLPGAHLHLPAPSAQPLTLLTGLRAAKGASDEVIVVQKDRSPRARRKETSWRVGPAAGADRCGRCPAAPEQRGVEQAGSAALPPPLASGAPSRAPCWRDKRSGRGARTTGRRREGVLGAARGCRAPRPRAAAPAHTSRTHVSSLGAVRGAVRSACWQVLRPWEWPCLSPWSL